MYVGGNNFRTDRNAAPGDLEDGAARLGRGGRARSRPTPAWPPGTGTRIGVDRDEDTFFDRRIEGAPIREPARLPRRRLDDDHVDHLVHHTTSSTTIPPVLVSTRSLT